MTAAFEPAEKRGSPLSPLLSPTSRRVPSPEAIWRPRLKYVLLLALAVSTFIVATLLHLNGTFDLRQLQFSAAGQSRHEREVRSLRISMFRDELYRQYPPIEKGGREVRERNFAALDRLAMCVAEGTCGPNEDKIALLASHHFGQSLAGYTAGENVWGKSTLDAFAYNNYTTLLSWGSLDTLFIYQGLADMVRVVFWEPEALRRCIARNASNWQDLENAEDDKAPWQVGAKACIQSVNYPEGVPYWMSFAWHYFGGWDGGANPLGAGWTLAPENYAENYAGKAGNTDSKVAMAKSYYLGYSIEDQCTLAPSYAHRDRQHRAVILAKRTMYFEPRWNFFYNLLHGVEQAVAPDSTGEAFKFVVMAGGDAGEPEPLAEPGLESIGRRPYGEWIETVARSKVFVGIGYPENSPSPYDALCSGVPFINVITVWDAKDPSNKDAWSTQSDALKAIPEPYVYHVYAHDAEGLTSAIQRASETPIDRYIPPHMRRESVAKRHQIMIETDWQSECKKTIESSSELAEAYCMDATGPVSFVAHTGSR